MKAQVIILPAALTEAEASAYVGGNTFFKRLLEVHGPKEGRHPDEVLIRPVYNSNPGKKGGGRRFYRRESIDTCLRALEHSGALDDDRCNEKPNASAGV